MATITSRILQKSSFFQFTIHHKLVTVLLSLPAGLPGGKIEVHKVITFGQFSSN